MDAFPHTRRPLPWVLAGFLAVLWFVPVDSTELKIHLPFDSRFDRAAVLVMILCWILFGGDQNTIAGRRRPKLFVGVTAAFVGLAVLSVLAGSGRIIRMGEFNLAEKQLILFGSYLAVAWFAMTALRVEDLRGMCRYLVGLATAMSVGMLIEARTGYNVFYEVSHMVLSPIATVAPSPTDIHPALQFDRVVVVGPTLHGLAAAAMLSVVMPFALVAMLDATRARTRWLNALAFALMLAAAIATERKTAIVVPLAVVVFLAFHRPRQILRLLPLGVVLLAFVHASAPGSLGNVLDLGVALNSNSTTHRESDLDAIMPDILAHPVLGQGFATVETERVSETRILDNEYLDEVLQMGLVGLAAYLAMIIAPIVLTRRVIRSGDPRRAPPALAGAAGCVAYLVVNALFDALSFPQAPYMFFIAAAICTVAATRTDSELAESDALVAAPSAAAPVSSFALPAGSRTRADVPSPRAVAPA
jgi:O-antigen ligase